MSERRPFYKQPLSFTIEASTYPNLKRTLKLDFHNKIPRISLNGERVLGQLKIVTSNHQAGFDGRIQIKKARVCFYDQALTREIEFDLVEFAPLITGIIHLGNLGIASVSKSEINLIKHHGPFSIKKVDGEPLKTALGEDVIETESTYDTVKIKRNKQFFLLDIITMFVLTNKFKKASKIVKELVASI